MTKMKKLNQSCPTFPGSNQNLLDISNPFYFIFNIRSQVKVQFFISNKLIILKLTIAELNEYTKNSKTSSAQQLLALG